MPFAATTLADLRTRMKSDDPIRTRVAPPEEFSAMCRQWVVETCVQMRDLSVCCMEAFCVQTWNVRCVAGSRYMHWFENNCNGITVGKWYDITCHV